MEAKSLYTSFRKYHSPTWRCPTCLNDTLEIVTDSFKEAETSDTIKYRHEDWFDEEMAKGVFSCLLRCSRKACRESVALSGETVALETFNAEMTDRWFEPGYRPKHFYPPIPLFLPPEKCPERIFDLLTEVSALIPAHPASAVNIMRTVVERMLDSLNVPKEREIKNGKRKGQLMRLSANTRIVEYPELLGEQSQAFMALKVLGNHGSHGGKDITRSAINDACAVIEHLLEFLFSESANVQEHIERINKAFSEDDDQETAS